MSDTKTVTIAVIEHFDIVANWHKVEKLKAYFEKDTSGDKRSCWYEQ